MDKKYNQSSHYLIVNSLPITREKFEYFCSSPSKDYGLEWRNFLTSFFKI